MSEGFIAAFKTNNRCVKDFPLDTFFKLTDGLQIDRGELVNSIKDILSAKIETVLKGPDRKTFQDFLSILLSDNEDQKEILKGMIEMMLRQSKEPAPSAGCHEYINLKGG